MPSIGGPKLKDWDQKIFCLGDEVYLKSEYDARGKPKKYIICDCEMDGGKNWTYNLALESAGGKDMKWASENDIGRWDDRPQETQANTDLIEL